jgi:hypothetical protein
MSQVLGIEPLTSPMITQVFTNGLHLSQLTKFVKFFISRVYITTIHGFYNGVL